MNDSVAKSSQGSPVTLADVARVAGVSTSAVSRTFTPGASVGKKTRAKVLDVASALGYRPNAIARTLSTKKSRIIGVVVSYLDNQFYPSVIEQLSQLLQSRGYHVLLFIGSDKSGSDQDTDVILLDILQYQVDGIVLASTMLSSDLSSRCTAAGIPVVLFNRTAPVEGVSTVTSDNENGGSLVAKMFIESGAKKIGFIAGLEDASTSQERELGFVRSLKRAGLSLSYRAVGDYSLSSARAVTRSLFKKGLGPDALFVANDHMAFGVLDALRIDLNLRVPEDVQVVGFDDVPQAAWGGYSLTTIKQDSLAMAQSTVTLLLKAIESEEPVQTKRVVIPVQIVWRATAISKALSI